MDAAATRTTVTDPTAPDTTAPGTGLTQTAPLAVQLHVRLVPSPAGKAVAAPLEQGWPLARVV